MRPNSSVFPDARIPSPVTGQTEKARAAHRVHPDHAALAVARLAVGARRRLRLVRPSYWTTSVPSDPNTELLLVMEVRRRRTSLSLAVAVALFCAKIGLRTLPPFC